MTAGRDGPATTAIPPADGKGDGDIIGVKIDYTNWRGERRVRVIGPLRLWYGATKYHPTPGYLLKAIDFEDRRIKDFAMTGIHQWGVE